MTEKMTFTFPHEVAKILRQQVKKGERSKFVAKATKEKIEKRQKKKLRKQLKEGYKSRARVHEELANEFYEAEEEAFKNTITRE